MENQEHFGRLTDRMAAFREEVLEEKPILMQNVPYLPHRPIKRIKISHE